ncbi:MAG: succinylglutamate desuccinylase/aspartoacylase family protein [Longimicrobiales bacterium]|nr:succinylglutamate desuccinylase/aspartoacylase family protein [Longimicrobiales bacterium]
MSGGVAEMSRGTIVDDRLLGGVVGRRPGPTLICFGGIHGNEPAGILALRRVLEALEHRRSDVSGRLVALAGNVTALERRRRFVDRDLNRAWTSARIVQLRTEGAGGTVEDREQVELLEEIEQVLEVAEGPVYALDLHTTSGPGGIFSAFTDSLPHRDFASHFPVPMIFGLEELVDGTLLNLLSEHGIVALTVETGQHDEPASVDRAEAAIWIALVSAGLLPERLVPELTEARKLLKRATGHLPRALEMRQKRDVEEGDGFVMEPGYTNFQPVRAGQVVAHDADGPVAVPESGRLLMPLYQEQGEDGFFLVREFSPFWMTVSMAMRRAELSRFVHLLPGVSRIEGKADEVVVDKRIARFFARQLMHLLGFRRLEDAGAKLIMKRRPFDEGRYLKRPPRPEPLEPEDRMDGPA